MLTSYLIDAVNECSRAEDHRHLVHQLHVVPQSHVEQPGAHADRQQGQVQEEESEITQVQNMTSFSYTCKTSCSHLGLCISPQSDAVHATFTSCHYYKN